MWALYEGDCTAHMRALETASIDAIVTDPPYELGFMGKRWDASGIAYNVDMWRECLRVLKPGGHLLAFGGTRTYHRMACAIEDAGFEIRDCIAWMYGTGFPKSLDISKAIDKEAGVTRAVAGPKPWKTHDIRNGHGRKYGSGLYAGEQTGHIQLMETVPATPAAIQWQGWGTGLKPAMEPIVVARKPLSEPTVAQNVLKWGTGGMNIDACRVKGDMASAHYGGRQLVDSKIFRRLGGNGYQTQPHSGGRWPANFVLDEEAAAMLDGMSGQRRGGIARRQRSGGRNFASDRPKPPLPDLGYSDSGGASRFYYIAKASSSERWFYCRDCRDAFPRKEREAHWHGHVNEKGEKAWGHLLEHPTVKPLSLMRWLCRLVTPPGGVILDPFAGSGTTLLAAVQEGFSVVGVEKEPEYCAIIRRRMAEIQPALPLAT